MRNTIRTALGMALLLSMGAAVAAKCGICPKKDAECCSQSKVEFIPRTCSRKVKVPRTVMRQCERTVMVPKVEVYEVPETIYEDQVEHFQVMDKKTITTTTCMEKCPQPKAVCNPCRTTKCRPCKRGCRRGRRGRRIAAVEATDQIATEASDQ